MKHGCSYTIFCILKQIVGNLIRNVGQNIKILDSNYLELFAEAFKDASDPIPHLEDTDTESSFS
jgi:hypothetical protein